MFIFDALLNSLLVVSSGYALYTLAPVEHPYGYTAAFFGLLHGLVGVVRAIKDDNNGQCNRIRLLSNGVMEIIPLPLINIELYMKSGNPNLAMAHGLFIIPLLYDILAKVGDYDDHATDALKDLTLMGNVISMLFLAVNENNNINGSMAGLAFFTRYLSALLERYYEGAGAEVSLVGNSGLMFLLAIALRN